MDKNDFIISETSMSGGPRKCCLFDFKEYTAVVSVPLSIL